MLTPDQIERCNALWRRLYARGAVRWMGGMLAAAPMYGSGFRVERVELRDDGPELVAGQHRIYGVQRMCPYWTDFATLGCLLAMAREATGIAHLHANDTTGVLKKPWHVWHVPNTEADSEPEALLLAIEEAINATGR